MERKYYLILMAVIVSAVFIYPYVPELSTGVIRACEYTVSEENCGKCYCLETADKGCSIIDISRIGDLSYAVNKTIIYYGTRNQNIIQSTKTCPYYVKLYIIKII